MWAVDNPLGDSEVTRKLRFLSLSGTIAVIHFSLFLLIVGYQRSFAGPDGVVHWTDENRPILELLNKAMFVHMFPIGWLSPLTDWLHWTETDVIVMVVLVATNSAPGRVRSGMDTTFRSPKSTCAIAS